MTGNVITPRVSGRVVCVSCAWRSFRRLPRIFTVEQYTCHVALTAGTGAPIQLFVPGL